MPERVININSMRLKDLLTVDFGGNKISIKEPNAAHPHSLVQSRMEFFSDGGPFAAIRPDGLVELTGCRREQLTFSNFIHRLEEAEQSQVVLIEGYAGCGKSTLVQYILAKQLGTYNYDDSLYNYNLQVQYNLLPVDESGTKRSSIFSAIEKSFFSKFINTAKGDLNVIECFEQLLQKCRDYSPFSDLYVRFYVTDTVKDAFRFAKESAKINEDSITDNLCKQSEQLQSKIGVLALDYLFRLALYKTGRLRRLYVCYDNLDAIEDAADLADFDDCLISFREHLDNFILMLWNDGFFQEKEMPCFVIVATYRKITASLANLSSAPYTEYQTDRRVDDNYQNVIHIDSTAVFSYGEIVSKRCGYFITALNNYLNLSNPKRTELINQLCSWRDLNESLSIMDDRYACLWNRNYRTCSRIADDLYSKDVYNFDKCVEFIKSNETPDGYEDFSDSEGSVWSGTYYGGSSVILSCLCKVFNNNHIWSDFMDLAPLNPRKSSYRNVSLARLILTFIYNAEDCVSFKDLYDWFCGHNLFSQADLCRILSKMLERNETGVWRRPIYYASNFIFSEQAEDIERVLLAECQYIQEERCAKVDYCFRLCESGVTYVEKLMQEFEFFSNRSNNANNCLYLCESIQELDRIINEVYLSVLKCCDNSRLMMKKVMREFHITANDDYLGLPIHPTTRRKSHQLHTERTIFSHIAYLNRVRLFYVKKTGDIQIKKRFHELFVNYIEKYLQMFAEKIMPICTKRQGVYEKLKTILSEVKGTDDPNLMSKSISIKP